ncbi:MAG: DUF2586 family protein [Crocinitomicaceae bacterium]|nr:DUF2586 family protein [Crocinitomicaceae bacterium]
MGEIINIQQSGGLGISAKSNDAVSGIIMHAPYVSGVTLYQLNSVYKLNSLVDIEALGLTELLDQNLEMGVYQALKEFFEVNPKGTLYFQPVLNTTPAVDLLNVENPNSAIKLVNFAQGKVSQLAVAFNPSDESSITDAVIQDVVAQAQVFALYCKEQNRPLHVVVEGFGIDGETDMREFSAKHVSCMIGQNSGFYERGAWAEKHTSIGRALGVISLAKVNESIGWVGKFNLQFGNFQKCRINGVLFEDLTPSFLDLLATNGYLHFITYSDFTGLYMNASYTCTVATDDFSTIEKNRTWNKAARLVRIAQLPSVNSTVFIDTTTGFISATNVAVLEAIGNKALQPMFQAGEISGPDPLGPTPPVQIDPNQDVLSTSNLQTQITIVPTGVAETITNYIGFSNPNN